MQKAGTGRADGSLVAARLWLSSEREGARLVVHLAAEPATLNKLPSLTCFGAPGSLSVSLKGLLQGPCAAWTNGFALTGASEQKATKMALVITFKLSFCSVTRCTLRGHTCPGREDRKTHQTLPPTTGGPKGLLSAKGPTREGWNELGKSSGTPRVAGRAAAVETKLRMEPWGGWAVQRATTNPPCCNAAKIRSALLRLSLGPPGSSGFEPHDTEQLWVAVSSPRCCYVPLALKIPGEREWWGGCAGCCAHADGSAGQCLHRLCVSAALTAVKQTSLQPGVCSEASHFRMATQPTESGRHPGFTMKARKAVLSHQMNTNCQQIFLVWFKAVFTALDKLYPEASSQWIIFLWPFECL